MAKKPKHTLLTQVQHLPKGLTVAQAKRSGLLVCDRAVTVAMRDCADGGVDIEAHGVRTDGGQMGPEELFHAWLLLAQLMGQMTNMPVEQRRVALHSIHLWQCHTAPVPVNPGQPC